MNDMIKTVQLPDLGSEIVTLYDLDLGDSNIVHFTTSIDDEGTPTVFDGNTYYPLPIQAEGFEIQSDGAYARPTLTVANLNNTFVNAVGTSSLEALTGTRLTRRTTLAKYLGAGPAVEYPKVSYIIDRISERNLLQVSFELAAPFDLVGVKLPRRQIIAGTCSWRYKGNIGAVENGGHLGACTWTETLKGSAVYISKNDEYIVNTTFDALGGSAVAGGFYSSGTVSLNRINPDGSYSAATKAKLWQCVRDSSGTPETDPGAYREVQRLNVYSSGTTYYAYDNPRYNDYVLSGGLAWKVKAVTLAGGAHPVAPSASRYWASGDSCGKNLESCSLRYFAAPLGNGGASATEKDKSTPLHFGGFPGSRQLG